MSSGVTPDNFCNTTLNNNQISASQPIKSQMDMDAVIISVAHISDPVPYQSQSINSDSSVSQQIVELQSSRQPLTQQQQQQPLLSSTASTSSSASLQHQPMQLSVTDDLSVEATSYTPAVGTGGLFTASSFGPTSGIPMVVSVGTSGDSSLSTSSSN